LQLGIQGFDWLPGGADGNLLVLNYGWALIQKPFIPMKLVQMVTEVLHSPDRSQFGGQEFNSRVDALGKAKPFFQKATPLVYWL
jgi:hypothetical protein